LDQNIRAVSGPRSLATILADLEGDIAYREFGDRAHEGFSEHYGDVLRWLDVRPRELYPHEVWRVPHSAIIPVARRVFWIESDTRQGLIHASVTSRNRIDIRAHRARQITISLHDRIVDLDAPIEIWINGERSFSGEVSRSAAIALEGARALGDERRIYAAEITVRVPTSAASVQIGSELESEVVPSHEEGILSFWEMYAQRALEERFPSLGITGDEVELPPGTRTSPEQVGFRVTQIDASSPLVAADVRLGDVLVQVGGEPIFRGTGGVEPLYSWIVRELRGEPREYAVLVQRGGVPITTLVELVLGPYGG
jgi:hypothetical protein